MVTLDFFYLPFGKLEYEATCFSHVDYQKKKGRKEIMLSDASFLLCQGIACTLRLSPHWTKANPVWPLSLKRQEICQILMERREKKTVKISTSKLNIGTGPDRREARPDYEWKPLSGIAWFFKIGDAIVVQKAPGCSENRQKSIAHLLRISELVCVECKWVPEHLSEQGWFGRKDNRQGCLWMSSAVRIAW